MKTFVKYITIIVLTVFLCGALAPSGEAAERRIEKPAASTKKNGLNVSVLDSVTIATTNTSIGLWGIESVNIGTPVFQLKVRNALENKIAGQQVFCTLKDRGKNNFVKAQCVNSKEEDLSLFMLQQGYVTANRGEIYGTLYERPYLDAEKNAQKTRNGVWAVGDNVAIESASGAPNKGFLIGSFLLMAACIIAFAILSFLIMRGFGRVVDVQNQSLDLAARERTLKDKEKFIVAAMIDAEVRNNKSKIEAYLTVYEETLLGFEDENIASQYQKTGDIVQKQPNLDRTIFDGNAARLDLFGSQVASNIIHYYARIKTNPDYIEIKPQTPQEQTRQIIETAVSNAKKLEQVSDKLLETLRDHALIKY